MVEPTRRRFGEAGLDFGRYRVIRELGAGGMARVYEARHVELDAPVALKVMHPALASDARAAARFLREGRAASAIRHQHVVRIFDVGSHQGQPFIVMELVEGYDLATLIARNGALPPSSAAELFLPVLSAVAAAHRAGVIHRDLKPANLMLAEFAPRSVHPVVLDFGISKLTAGEEPDGLTRSESLLGTVEYMAPELTRGARFASELTDQYALGVMLYECLTGRRPFTGASHYELMHAVVTAEVLPPSKLRERVPEALDALVLKAMHRDPASRFPSVRAFGGELLRFVETPELRLWNAEFWGHRRSVDELWFGAAHTATDHALDSAVRAPRLEPGRGSASPKRTRPRSVRVALAVGAPLLIVVGTLGVRSGSGAHNPDQAAVAAPRPEPRAPIRAARAAEVAERGSPPTPSSVSPSASLVSSSRPARVGSASPTPGRSRSLARLPSIALSTDASSNTPALAPSAARPLAPPKRGSNRVPIID